MNISKIQQEWIDKYLRNELEEEALGKLHFEMEHNADFKHELTVQIALAKAAKLNAVKDVMSKARTNNVMSQKQKHPQFKYVQNIIKQAKYKNENQNNQKTIRKWLVRGTIAASFLFIGLIVKNINLKADVQKEIVSVYENLKISNDQSFTMEQVGARSDVISIKLNKLSEAFNEKRYNESLSLIQQLEQQLKYESDNLSFAKAVLYSQLDDSQRSIEVLSKLVQKNSAYGHDALWFMSMINLEVKNKESAEKGLKLLIKDSNLYRSRAEKKLEKHF